MNVRGIKSKLKSVESALHSHGTHIAGMTETHLTEGEQINIPGYIWIGKPRHHKEGGRVGFLIRQDISKLVEVMNNPQQSIAESLWISIKTRKPIAAGILYCKQENEKRETIEQQFQEMTTHTNQLQNKFDTIVMGDLNAKIEFNTDNCKQREPKREVSSRIPETNKYHYLEQNQKTQWNMDTSEQEQPRKISIIDDIIVNQALGNKVVESETDNNGTYIIEGKNETDHNTITATINTKAEIQETIIRKWKQGNKDDWNKYNEEILEKWNKGEKNQSYQTLIDIIKTSMEKHIGKRTINTNRKTKITNDEIKKAKEERKLLKQKNNAICKTKNNQQINDIKTQYVTSQQMTRKLIEK